jgi:multiple antibiotic resistance protein
MSSDYSDIAVFPLGTPLIAGAGSMGAAILLMAETEGDFSLQLLWAKIPIP